MKEIINYNPDLGLTLNDLSILLVLEEADELYDGSHIADILEAIHNSVKEDEYYTFQYKPKQMVYDILMEKVSTNVKEYEKHLLEEGYGHTDIIEYHNKMRELNKNEEDED